MSGSAAPDYSDLFEQAGQQYGVDPTLLKAVSTVENAKGDPNATSSAGAKGVMQLMPQTAQAVGVTDRADPAQSIYGAAAVLRQNLDRYGNVPDALRAYNAGTDQSKWGNPETSAYVPKVAAAYQVASANSNTATDATETPATPATAQASADPDRAALEAEFGLVAKPLDAAPSQTAAQRAALEAEFGLVAPAAAPTAAPAALAAQAPRYAADGSLLIPEDATTATGDTTALSGIRNALAPAPNTTYGSVLPLAKDNTTGAIRLALPSSLRSLAEGGLDLAEGPATGTVTPAATMALASGVLPAGMRGADASGNALTTQAATPAARGNPLSLAPDAAAPVAGSGVPTSMGAAISRDTTNPLSGDASFFANPREAQASRATGEAQRLALPAPVGQDNTIYVQGSKPTAADVSGDAGTSGQYKALRQMPGNESAYVERDQQNNLARIDHFDNLAGTPTTLNTLQAARSAQAQTDLAAAWANKQPADAQPVVDTINGILASPDGKRPAVQKALSGVMDTLQNADGTGLETDPEQLYGARKAIDDTLSKAGAQDNPLSVRVAANLQQVKQSLDGVIEPAAPGFDTYLQNYAAASKPIDTQQLLQQIKPTLTDASGTMQLGRVQSMMKQIVAARQTPGIDPANSIDDDTMDGLWNLRSDLLRQNNRNLGRPAGSDTSQLLAYGNKLSLTAAHGIAAHVAPVVGNALVHFSANALSARSLARRNDAMLNPDMTGSDLNAP